jgi:hypothetical protein
VRRVDREESLAARVRRLSLEPFVSIVLAVSGLIRRRVSELAA